MRFVFHRRALAPLAVPRSRLAVTGTLLAGRFVAFAGGSTRRASDKTTGVCEVQCWSSGAVEILDVESGLLTRGPDLVEPRESAFCAWKEGQLLVAGGIADHG